MCRSDVQGYQQVVISRAAGARKHWIPRNHSWMIGSIIQQRYGSFFELSPNTSPFGFAFFAHRFTRCGRSVVRSSYCRNASEVWLLVRASYDPSCPLPSPYPGSRGRCVASPRACGLPRRFASPRRQHQLEHWRADCPLFAASHVGFMGLPVCLVAMWQWMRGRCQVCDSTVPFCFGFGFLNVSFLVLGHVRGINTATLEGLARGTRYESGTESLSFCDPTLGLSEGG